MTRRIENEDMNGLQGTIRNGQIVLDAPSVFPDGTRVEVLPIERPSLTPLGMPEEQWPATPSEIAAHLARMDQVGPGWLSPADDDAWRTALREQREIEKAQFFRDAERTRSMWE